MTRDRGLSEGLWRAAVALAVFFLLQALHAWAVGRLRASTSVSSTAWAPVAELLLYGALLPGLGALLFWRALPALTGLHAGTPAAALAPPFLPMRRVAFDALLALAAAAGLALLAVAHAHIRSMPGNATSPPVSGGMALVIAILATPLLEEFFYRAQLQRFLAGNPLVALAVQALLFAAMHPWAVFPVMLVAGVTFGGLYWRRGLATAILAHVGYNAALVLLAGVINS